MSYPKDLLATRAVVKPGLWAVIPKEGLVNNVIPNITGCKVSIIASPKMGAGFVQYVVEAVKDAGTTSPFAAEEGIESFAYVVERLSWQQGIRKRPFPPVDMPMLLRAQESASTRSVIPQRSCCTNKNIFLTERKSLM